MPRWLTEDPTIVYLVLALAALVVSVAWWLRQERKYLIGAIVIAGLFILIAALDHFIVTDREQLVVNMTEMCDSVARKDVDRIFANVSDNFDHGGRSKSAFRKLVDLHIQNGDVTSVAAWDFEPGEVERAKGEGRVTFLVKARGPQVGDALFYRCTAIFALDPDGKWRLRDFELHDPTNSANKLDLPN